MGVSAMVAPWMEEKSRYWLYYRPCPRARWRKPRGAGGAQRPRPESSRSQAETACSLLSASRRRAARAWLALIEFGDCWARPARGGEAILSDAEDAAGGRARWPS